MAGSMDRWGEWGRWGGGQVIHYGVPYRDGRKWWWPLPEREETSWRESLAPGGQVRPRWSNSWSNSWSKKYLESGQIGDRIPGQ